MALPELEKARVVKLLDEFSDEIPDRFKHRLKKTYSIRGNDITLFEERQIRPDKWSKMPIAKFKYDPEKNKWSLRWPDSKDKWHDYYKEIKCSKNPGKFEALLEEVKNDSMGIFWG